MDQGRIVQSGTPVEIYQAPQERFVANFVGSTNFLEGNVGSVALDGNSLGVVHTAQGKLHCVLQHGILANENVIIVVRPEDIRIITEDAAEKENVLRAKVDALIFMGDALECQLSVGNQRLRTKLHPSSGIRQGDIVSLHLPAQCCRALRGS
jgi:iron(III) transport system ATP-binding protein